MQNAQGNIILTLLVFVPVILFFLVNRTKKSPEQDQENPEHHPVPAAAPAAAGHGGGHDHHGDHGHGVPWSSHVIAVLVVLFVLGGIPAGVVWFVNRDEPAKETRSQQPESQAAGSKQTTDSVCGKKPSVTETIEIPVEGAFGPITVPRHQLTCIEPVEKLRAKWSRSEAEPAEWGGDSGKYLWVGIIPGESSEPLTVEFWLVPY